MRVNRGANIYFYRIYNFLSHLWFYSIYRYKHLRLFI